MGILNQLIEENSNVLLATKIYDLVYPDWQKVTKLNLKSSPHGSDKHLKDLLNILIKYRGKEIGFYKFELDGDSCVLVYCEPDHKSNDLLDINNYPIFSSYNKRNPLLNHYVPDPSKTSGPYRGYWYDKEGNIINDESIFIKKHNRLLCILRLIKTSSTGNLPNNNILLYSFYDSVIKSELVVRDEKDFFSIYFEAETWCGDDVLISIARRNQLLIFFNNFNNEIVLKDLRLVKVNDHRLVDIKKLSEFKYLIEGYHVVTIGSNNWDIDTDSIGVFDFLKNAWDSFEEKVTHHKL